MHRMGQDTTVRTLTSLPSECSKGDECGIRDDVTVVVMAKEPVPGRSKTRLCPPLTWTEAAEVARAALNDTLAVVSRLPVARRVLVLDGRPAGLVPPGVEVIPQAGGGLDERLAAAFDRVGGPSLLIGMDTPQITFDLMESAVELFLTPDVDAVLGLSEDGGWWAIGLQAANPGVFIGVPMSTPITGVHQRAQMDQYGLRVRALPQLRDVDTFDDAKAVAELIPESRFASALRRIRHQ
jgi:glycosyltransferase A (GT-A) superfamily protein (DUF2064 family)